MAYCCWYLGSEAGHRLGRLHADWPDQEPPCDGLSCQEGAWWLTPTPDTNSTGQRRSAPDPSGLSAEGHGRWSKVTDRP